MGHSVGGAALRQIMLIEGIDDSCNSPEETACMKLWVWMEDVNMLAKKGKLKLEEPEERSSPGMRIPQIGIFEDASPRTAPLNLLSFDVLLHLDCVHDYSGSPNSSVHSHRPKKWYYRWYLHSEDGIFPPPPPRVPVHSRLRFPGRRDPDGGGGGSGSSDDHSRRSSGWDQGPDRHSGNGDCGRTEFRQFFGGGGRNRQAGTHASLTKEELSGMHVRQEAGGGTPQAEKEGSTLQEFENGSGLTAHKEVPRASFHPASGSEFLFLDNQAGSEELEMVPDPMI